MAQRADPGGIDLDREALLGVLARHRVAFVLIGGAAIQSHGLRYDTRDMDVTPDTTPENLAALGDALNELDCRLITDPADEGSWVPLPPDYFTERSLRSASLWNLATRHGQLDLCFTPAGFPHGYTDLEPRARQRSLKRLSSCQSPPLMMSTSPSVRPIDRRTASIFNAPWNRSHDTGVHSHAPEAGSSRPFGSRSAAPCSRAPE